MKEFKITELALTTLMESMDKAASVIDLVRIQLGERYEGRPGFTTDFQLATLLEFVDNLIMAERDNVNDMIQQPAQ